MPTRVHSRETIITRRKQTHNQSITAPSRKTPSGRVQSGVGVVPSPRNRFSAFRPARVIVLAASEYKTWKAPPRARPRHHYHLTSQLPTQPKPLFIVTQHISPESPAFTPSPPTIRHHHASQEDLHWCREEGGACSSARQLPWYVFASFTRNNACEKTLCLYDRWLTSHSHDPGSCYQRTCRQHTAMLAESATPTVACFGTRDRRCA